MIYPGLIRSSEDQLTSTMFSNVGAARGLHLEWIGREINFVPNVNTKKECTSSWDAFRGEDSAGVAFLSRSEVSRRICWHPPVLSSHERNHERDLHGTVKRVVDGSPYRKTPPPLSRTRSRPVLSLTPSEGNVCSDKTHPVTVTATNSSRSPFNEGSAAEGTVVLFSNKALSELCLSTEVRILDILCTHYYRPFNVNKFQWSKLSGWIEL